MSWRHERRKVVEAVAVETPHERSDDLPDRRDPDDGQRLQPNRPRLEHQQAGQHARREEPEHELPRVPDGAVEHENGGDPGADDGERDEREAAHCSYLRGPIGMRFDGGIPPLQLRADTRRMIWPVAALAVFLLGFVVVYGSVLQSRVEAGLTARGREDSGVDTEIA